ncbi:phage antirepressor N-terminal domain-containing protein [Halomonas sp. Mc5H-6]|uniref:phage antirepressor N-terminal domain-containing protein n=1 Tax=Halomonas sp. Mc5H-6 TaxID=2954500 RepID=UPI0020982CC8|nr:phage antirepressor N-terminal domain-containing protein [Halomonas sp. Mc5H-6]MCO7246356.1 phage antirepressor N-terminal domain-containing protein [Halomonas sp. Mc5H-6]
MTVQKAFTPVSINFHGANIPTFNVEGVVRVAMKPICDAIGLGWQSQWHRIKRHPVLKSTVVMMTTVARDGKSRKLATLPLNKLNGWLFGVDASRVKPEIREKLVEYQAECFDVLSDYWQKGQAVNPRTATPDERAGLRAAVTMLTTKRGMMHSDAYRLVHHRFNVEHIDELSTEQVPAAVEYVHRMALEGDYLEQQTLPVLRKEPAQGGAMLTDIQLYDVWFVTTRLEVLYDIFKRYELYQAMRLLGSRAGTEMIDHFRDGQSVASRLHKNLDEEFDAVQRRMGVNQFADSPEKSGGFLESTLAH